MPQMMPRTYLQGLRMGINDEIADARTYEYMASIAPNPVIAQRIQYISNDEATHSVILTNLLTAAGSGSHHEATDAESMHHREFWNMVQDAYEDEVNAVMFYAHLSLMAPSLAVAARIRDIMRDEMVHAEFFNTLLMTRQPTV